MTLRTSSRGGVSNEEEHTSYGTQVSYDKSRIRGDVFLDKIIKQGARILENKLYLKDQKVKLL